MAAHPTRRLARPSVVAAAAALLLVAIASAALAQTIEPRLDGKVRTGTQVVVDADETVDGDLYVTAGNVVVDGTVSGDLVAAGGRVDVSGTVEGDALVSGGDVRISGEVDGDVRIGAGQATISGTVGEDVLVGAGQVTIASSATIGEDLVFATGQMRMRGTVEGGALGTAGSYVETGSIAGSRDISEAPEPQAPSFADRVLDVVGRYVAILLVGALLLWLASRFSGRGIERIRREPWPSLGVGVLTLIAAAVVVVGALLVGVVITILLALVGLGSLAATLTVAVLFGVLLLVFALVVAGLWVAPVLVGTWLGRFVVRDGERWVTSFAALAIGAVAIVVLGALPYLGPVVSTIVFLLGVGAIVLAAFRRRQDSRSNDQVPSPPARTAPRA